MSQRGADDWWQKLYEDPEAERPDRDREPDPGDTLENRFRSAAGVTAPPAPGGGRPLPGQRPASGAPGAAPGNPAAPLPEQAAAPVAGPRASDPAAPPPPPPAAVPGARTGHRAPDPGRDRPTVPPVPAGPPAVPAPPEPGRAAPPGPGPEGPAAVPPLPRTEADAPAPGSRSGQPGPDAGPRRATPAEPPGPPAAPPPPGAATDRPVMPRPPEAAAPVPPPPGAAPGLPSVAPGSASAEQPPAPLPPLPGAAVDRPVTPRPPEAAAPVPPPGAATGRPSAEQPPALLPLPGAAVDRPVTPRPPEAAGPVPPPPGAAPGGASAERPPVPPMPPGALPGLPGTAPAAGPPPEVPPAPAVAPPGPVPAPRTAPDGLRQTAGSRAAGDGAPVPPPVPPPPVTPPAAAAEPPSLPVRPRDPRTGGATGYALGGVDVPPVPLSDPPAATAGPVGGDAPTEHVPRPAPAEDAAPPPPDGPRPTVHHLGDRAPTYAAEPGALPAADPAALDALVPDTVLEGARHGSHTLRAASVRGDSARYRGEHRRDFLLTARFGSGEDALVLVALAGGDRAAPGAADAAAELCRTVAAAVGRSRDRLAEDIRAGRRDALRSGLQRLTDRGYGRLRARAAELGLAETEYTAGLRGLLLPVDPRCRTRVCFGAGAGGLFRLRSGQWQDLEPGGPAEPPPAADGDAEGGPAFRFRASVARTGDVLLLCSGGLAEPMREESALPEELAARWAEPEPPGLAAFLADTQLRLKGYADDRTAAAVWEA
ncbi:protein phosphatase 2C domain-containing protein [Streptomyces sp. NPDC089922]|uniref:protein phosphatase 2C domain-containing protein n=1 Tax=Streptomyces sp. NPDC089922 TaxID=3155189 RepID=UPI00342605DC